MRTAEASKRKSIETRSPAGSELDSKELNGEDSHQRQPLRQRHPPGAQIPKQREWQRKNDQIADDIARAVDEVLKLRYTLRRYSSIPEARYRPAGKDAQKDDSQIPSADQTEEAVDDLEEFDAKESPVLDQQRDLDHSKTGVEDDDGDVPTLEMTMSQPEQFETGTSLAL